MKVQVCTYLVASYPLITKDHILCDPSHPIATLNFGLQNGQQTTYTQIKVKLELYYNKLVEIA